MEGKGKEMWVLFPRHLDQVVLLKSPFETLYPYQKPSGMVKESVLKYDAFVQLDKRINNNSRVYWFGFKEIVADKARCPPRTRPPVIGFYSNVRITSSLGAYLRENVEMVLKKYYVEKHNDIPYSMMFGLAVGRGVLKGQVDFLLHKSTEIDSFSKEFPHNFERESGRRGR